MRFGRVLRQRLDALINIIDRSSGGTCSWRIEDELSSGGILGSVGFRLHPLERLAAVQLRPAAGARSLDAVREGRERLEVELELPQPVEHAPVLGVAVGSVVVVVRRRERLGLVHRERVDGAERDERERGEAGEHGRGAGTGARRSSCLIERSDSTTYSLQYFPPSLPGQSVLRARRTTRGPGRRAGGRASPSWRHHPLASKGRHSTRMPIVSWFTYCWRECATPKSRAKTLRWSPFGAAAAPRIRLCETRVVRALRAKAAANGCAGRDAAELDAAAERDAAVLCAVGGRGRAAEIAVRDDRAENGCDGNVEGTLATIAASSTTRRSRVNCEVPGEEERRDASADARCEATDGLERIMPCGGGDDATRVDPGAKGEASSRRGDAGVGVVCIPLLRVDTHVTGAAAVSPNTALKR